MLYCCLLQNKIYFAALISVMKQQELYKVEPTKRTPRIILRPGRIFVVGRSIPENPGIFYRPVYEWIVDYIKSGTEETSIEFGFEYINTSSTKWIYNIIKEIAKMKNLEENVKIYWYYDRGDEDMCELGFILRSLVECQFHIIEVDGMNRDPEDSFIVGSYCY